MENAGVENAGVEKAGAITYGKPSEQKTLKIPECRLKCVFIFARICFLFFPVTIMPFFGLQAYVGNYQKNYKHACRH